MTKDEGQFLVRYTTRDIMSKLEEQHELLEKIHHQAQVTNGRVTCLENKSIGMWISNHVWQAFMIGTIFFVIVISDFRHPIIDFLMRII